MSEKIEKLNKEIKKNPDFVFYDFETGTIGKDLKNFITTIEKEAREEGRNEANDEWIEIFKKAIEKSHKEKDARNLEEE